MRAHILAPILTVLLGLLCLPAAAEEETSPLPIGQSTTAVDCLISNDATDAAVTTLTLYSATGMIIHQGIVDVPALGIARLWTPRRLLPTTTATHVWCQSSSDLGEISICDMRPGYNAAFCVTND